MSPDPASLEKIAALSKSRLGVDPMTRQRKIIALRNFINSAPPDAMIDALISTAGLRPKAEQPDSETPWRNE